MGILVIGQDDPPTRQLQGALAADHLLAFPALAAPGDSWAWGWRDDLERWERQAAELGRFDSVVVCCWDAVEVAVQFVDLSPRAWLEHLERRLALWMIAAKVGVGRCADGGSLVMVVERPAALDTLGRSALVGAAEGVLSLSRCMAASEGRRGVRVNAVATELWTVPDELLGPAPALTSFPGRVDAEVAGAVRMLLSDDAVGVTGSVSTPDGGRAA